MEPYTRKTERVREVLTGEVRTESAGTIMLVSALGSCIAVVMLDPLVRIGGIAHVMLPGKCRQEGHADRFRYADDAITELLSQMLRKGAKIEDLVVCLAGAGNVLQRPEDSICSLNIEAVSEVLSRLGLTVSAQSLGGVQRRSVRLDIAAGTVLYSEGGGKFSVLFGQAPIMQWGKKLC
ncbi:MAG: chemotaxis protein CheD [Nitrospirae bacterium]|nr:chemotaxis protein CheD [Nitrospirota bacterium]